MEDLSRVYSEEGKQIKNKIELAQRRRNGEGRYVQKQGNFFYKDICDFKQWK